MQEMIAGKSASLNFDPTKHDRQFNHVYFCRLAELSIHIRKSFEATKFSGLGVSKIVNLQTDRESFIIGTAFYDINYITELSEQILVDMTSKSRSFTGHLYLEDDSARVRVDVSGLVELPFVTGLTIGLAGILEQDGIFHVKDYVFAGFPPPRYIQEYLGERDGVLMLSDVCCSSLRLHILKDFLASSFATTRRKLDQDVSSTASVVDYEAVDSFLANPSLDCFDGVWVIPSSLDPTSTVWPLISFNRLLLPNSSKNEKLGLCNSPFHLELCGKSFIGSDSASFDDWKENCTSKDASLEKLACTLLQSRCFAPTAPNSLSCFPFEDIDPFILNYSPDFLVIGNQEHAGLVDISPESNTTLCCVPSFKKTSKIAMLSARSKKLDIIAFDANGVTII